jgi:hypothetical protein
MDVRGLGGGGARFLTGKFFIREPALYLKERTLGIGIGGDVLGIKENPGKGETNE